MTTYIVGDIQACHSALIQLLDKVAFDPDKDKLWAVGDLIGRGPEALETLNYLYSLGPSFDTVLGNHDLHFLAVSCGARKPNAKDRFDTLLRAKQHAKLVDWLRQKSLATTINNHLFLSHAGLYPLWDINDAIGYSKQVEAVLQGEQWHHLLHLMYESKPLKWQEKLSRMEKFRFIIDAFTRMRYLNEDDSLNFSYKGPIKKAPAGLKPWFEHHRIRQNNDCKLVFGHWASLEGKTSQAHCVGLDTGYIWGNKLTLLCTDNMTQTFIAKQQ